MSGRPGALRWRRSALLRADTGRSAVRNPFALERATPHDAVPITARALIARRSRAAARLMRERVGERELLGATASE